MLTRAQAMESEKRTLEAEKRVGDILTDLSLRQEVLHKQAQEQRQESRAQIARTEARFDELLQMITAMSLQIQSKKASEEGEALLAGEKNEESNMASVKNGWGKSTRLEFPKFEGEVSKKEKVYEDPLADLRNLRQVSSLQAYMDEFDELCPRTGIREDQALIDELQMPVRMFKPKTLADAYALAMLQERTVAAMHSKSKPVSSYSQYSATYSSQTKPLTVTSSSYKPSQTSGVGKEGPRAGSMSSGVKSGPKNTSKDMEERRAKGLCFWCDERYTPQHKCPKRRVYSLQLLEEEEGNFELPLEVTEEVSTDLQLSLHAMWGLEGNQIMRIKGESQGRQLKVLIDRGVLTIS